MAKRELFAGPDYFAERTNADGSKRYYWKASKRIADLLEGSPHRSVVRLTSNDPEAECRAITARVEAWLAIQPVRRPSDARGTLGAAIVEYKLSRRYRDLADKTQKDYGQVLGLIKDWAGDCAWASLTKKDVAAAAAKFEATPRKQEIFLVLLAMLIDMAASERGETGGVIINPARAVLANFERPEPEGGWVWPGAAVDRFATAADILGFPSIATMIRLNEWLGQRPGDLLTLPRQAYRDGILHVVQSKTGQYVPLPVDTVKTLDDLLRAHIAREEKAARDAKVRPLVPASTLFVCETTRQPWGADHFRHEFMRIRAAVAGGHCHDAHPKDIGRLGRHGLWPVGGFMLDPHTVPRRLWQSMRLGPAAPIVPTMDLRFSHLRHTGITRLRQAGCTDDQIRSISGHRQPEVIYKHYLAVTVETARAAFGRRDDFERASG